MTEEEKYRVFPMLLASDEELTTLGAAAFTQCANWEDYHALRAEPGYNHIPLATRKILRKEIAYHWGTRDNNGKLLKKYKGV